MRHHQVVIVGGGTGGIAVAARLARQRRGAPIRPLTCRRERQRVEECPARGEAAQQHRTEHHADSRNDRGVGGSHPRVGERKQCDLSDPLG